LVGDDQQLAAIGAGGILRDIKTSTVSCIPPSCIASPNGPKGPRHSPSATATRDRSTFYVDHGRIRVGDLANTTEDAFNAWVPTGPLDSTRS
jgi:hypothetical protein